MTRYVSKCSERAKKPQKPHVTTHPTIPTIKISAALLPSEKQDSSPDVLESTIVCAIVRTVATSEFARTWIWFRGPSPPSAPVADSVNRALISCLTYAPSNKHVSLVLNHKFQSLYLRDLRTAEVEHGQEHKRGVPRVQNVRGSGQPRKYQAKRRE